MIVPVQTRHHDVDGFQVKQTKSILTRVNTIQVREVVVMTLVSMNLGWERRCTFRKLMQCGDWYFYFWMHGYVSHGCFFCAGFVAVWFLLG